MNYRNLLYINLVPIKTGGGLIQTIYFLDSLENIKHEYSISFTCSSLEIKDILEDKGFQFDFIKNTNFSRLKFDLFYYFNKRNSIILTLYGPKPILTYGNFTFSGFAQSQLLHPHIDIYRSKNLFLKLHKKLKDFYRIRLYFKTDVLLFETKYLLDLASLNKRFKNKKMTVVKPTFSFKKKNNHSLQKKLDDNSKVFTILYLATGHPNKRHDYLIKIAKSLAQHTSNFKFITTLKKSNYLNNFNASIRINGLTDYISNIGHVKKDKLNDIISDSDALINLALLESFSNNFIEAWAHNKPLIVSRFDWSEAILTDAAFFIDPFDNKKAAIELCNLINNENERKKIVLNYAKKIQAFPSPIEKARLYLKIINLYTS